MSLPGTAQPGLRVGLTGGIGSGKSTVAKTLAELGALVIDTDELSRSLTAPGGAALAAIAATFGADMLAADGAMDRARMRALVFDDAAARRQLESILHPMIAEETRQRASKALPGQSVVFDVPLLVESGRWRDQVDRILVVDCSEATQVQRVMSRNGWPEEQVRRVIAQQATREQRRAIADAVLVNDGISLESLSADVRSLWQHWHPAEPAKGPHCETIRPRHAD